MKFHVNPETGDPGRCSAREGKCPFGGSEDHYGSPADARAAYEAAMGSGIAVSSPKPLDFATLASRVTGEDREYGMEQAARQLQSSSFREWGWEALMGDRRRTAKAQEEYNDLLRQGVEANPEYLKIAEDYSRTHARRDAFARAYEQDVPIDPTVEAEFEAMWKGSKKGKSEAALLEERDDVRKMKEGLLAGTVKPSSVVGGGLRNSRRAAEDYLNRREEELERSLLTRGRSESVNFTNAVFRAREAGVRL